MNIVEITVTQNGEPVPNVSVTVRHAQNDEGAVVRVRARNEAGELVDADEATKKTDDNGKTGFVFVARGEAPEGGGNVKYDIHYINGEGRLKRDPTPITIRVVPHDPEP